MPDEPALAAEVEKKIRGIRAEGAVVALRWFARTPPILWALANYSAERRRPAASIPLREQLLRLGVADDYDVSFPFDPSILSPRATEFINVLQSSGKRSE